jgi:LysR family nitrogen assimilation transcriptional regulator
MDLRQMQCFVSLFEEQSITKAARRLNVVQPAVSMQIKRLEEEYGVKLFERTSQGVYATAPAKKLYPLCIAALDRLSAGRKLLREAAGRVAGTLSIGVPPSLAHGMLSLELLSFQERNPDVQLQVREGYSADLVGWLMEGHIDFAIVSVREGDARLRYRAHVSEELVVVTGSDPPFNTATVRGRDLADLKLVLPSSQNLIRHLIETEFHRVGLSLMPAMEVDSLAIVLRLLMHTGWASILPVSATLHDAGPQTLKSFRLVEPSIRRTLAIALDPKREASPAAELLIGQLEAALVNLGAVKTQLPDDDLAGAGDQAG